MIFLKAMTALGNGLLDVIYPPRCLGCGARPESPRLPLCPACLQSISRAPQEDVDARMSELGPRGTMIRRAAALWTFDKGGALQAVQHAVKYGDRPRYAIPLGRLMAAAVRDLDGVDASGITGVVPIPLHRTRELERGFNQAEMLACGLSEALDKPVRPRLLSRPTPTRSQTSLSREARWTNVEQAFAASEAAHGGTWLLVDDVLTTGSTAAAAAAALCNAGATSVIVVTLALASA